MLTMVFIAVTAVSRDGKNAVFIKYVPVSYYHQFQYKLIPAILISFFPILVVLLVAYVALKIDLELAIMCFIIATLINIVYSYTMLIVDLKRPKLNWETEYAVVKQNFNMIFAFAFMIAYVALLILIGFLFSNVNMVTMFGIIFILTAIILVGVDRYVYHNQEKLFTKIS